MAILIKKKKRSWKQNTLLIPSKNEGKMAAVSISLHLLTKSHGRWEVGWLPYLLPLTMLLENASHTVRLWYMMLNTVFWSVHTSCLSKLTEHFHFSLNKSLLFVFDMPLRFCFVLVIIYNAMLRSTLSVEHSIFWAHFGWFASYSEVLVAEKLWYIHIKHQVISQKGSNILSL